MVATGAQARDATVRSFDQTAISMHFFPAAGLAAGKRAPTVLIGPGWSMAGETDENSSSEELFGGVGVGPLRAGRLQRADLGPARLRQSGGAVEVDSPDYEARDVSALIDWLAQQPEAQLDKAGDPRVGMNGSSYGGGIQWVTAARDPRVDVITPNISWNSLLTSLYKDGALKFGWGERPVRRRHRRLAPGRAAEPRRPGAVAARPARAQHLHQRHRHAASCRPPTRPGTRPTGPDTLLSRVKIPTLITQGTADTLFTLKEAIRNYASLRSRGVPVKMLWFCGGHGVCLTGSGEAGHIERAVVNWLARYLKRDTSVQTGPRFEWLADDAKWRSAADYPLTRRGSLTAITGQKTLPIAPTSPSGGLIAATPAVNAVEVALPAASGNAHIVGEPTLKLTYSGTAVAAKTHVYAQIVDGSGHVVGNQATPIPVTLDGLTHTIERPLEAIASEAVAGSSYRLQITPATTLYTPQRSAGRRSRSVASRCRCRSSG